jgi:hypothetical protein
MNKVLLKLHLVVFISIFATSTYGQKRAQKKADEDTNNWRYEIECLNVSSEGSYIIKVFSYSKNKNVAIAQCKKNAIHGIIFRGIPQNEIGCVRQPPLARHPNLEEKNSTFFKSFFSENGDFKKFVTLTTDGAIAPEDRLRVGKKEYKIGLIVSVDISGLRKQLESAGIIKGLSSGF